jgi:DNA repair exonuclease SbcCD ATPase subunit
MAALLEATRADSELAREATELTRTRAEAFAGLLADARDDVITASGEAKGAIDESVRSAARASDQATEALEAARSDANGVKTIVAEVQGEAAKIEEAKALAETKAQEVEAAAAKALEAVDSSNQAAEQAAAAAGKADNAIEAAGARASEIDAAAERLEREIAETSDAIASAKQSAEDATGLAATLAANPGLRRAVIDALTEVGTRQTELVKVEVAALRGMLEASESKIAALQGENEALKLGAMPTGSIVVFWADATKVPDGWLLCDGRKLADLTDAKYAKLKEVLGALKMETLPDLTAGLLPGDIETVPIEGQPPAPTVNFIIRY